MLATSTNPTPDASPGSDSADVEQLFNDFESWLSDASGTLITVGFILLAMLIAWGIGRLVIRGVVRGIADGGDWGREQAQELLVRVKLSEAEEETLEERLADERRKSRAKTIGAVLRTGLNVVIIVVGTLLILAEVGLDVGPLIASAGIVGVALGFGAQSLVKDLISGMFMLMEDQYGVGDVIDVGEAAGVVEEIGLRVTQLRALDGTAWFVPNGEITRVGNMTQTWSRVLLEVRFAYDTDVEEARAAMLEAVERARQDDEIEAAMIGEPEVAGIENMDYNAVMLRLLQQVKPVTQWSVMRSIRQHMRDIFVERGLSLAAPEGSLIQSDATSPTKPARKRAPRKGAAD